MRPLKLKFFPLAIKSLVVFAITSSLLNGVEILNNLSNKADLNFQVNGTTLLAQKIMMSEVDQQIQSLTIITSKGQLSATGFVEIYTDCGGAPSGVLVGSFDTSGIRADEVNHATVLPVHCPFTLCANKDYWIVLATNKPQVTWQSTLDPSSLGTCCLAEGAASFDSGATWYYFAHPQRRLTVSLDALD